MWEKIQSKYVSVNFTLRRKFLNAQSMLNLSELMAIPPKMHMGEKQTDCGQQILQPWVTCTRVSLVLRTCLNTYHTPNYNPIRHRCGYCPFKLWMYTVLAAQIFKDMQTWEQNHFTISFIIMVSLI